MNSKTILSSLLLTAAASTQAGLLPDAKAHEACLARFKAVNQSEELQLHAEQSYRSAESDNRSLHYYFNASTRDNARIARKYRIECRASRIGRVTEFTIKPGRWRYQQPQTNQLAHL